MAEQIHNALGASGVPFTLLLDACYPNDEMQSALTRISMATLSADGSDLVYFGSQDLITDEMSHLAHSIRDIGNRLPYRCENNAVIFSAKPGAKAMFKPNPLDPYGLDLPPLAARLVWASQFGADTAAEDTLARLIRSNIDTVGGLGEITLAGTITWSDLDSMMSTLGRIHRTPPPALSPVDDSVGQ